QRDESFGALRIERRHLEDVRAADEGLVPGAGEDDRAQIVACGQRLELADQGDHQMAAERVELGGVLDRHARYRAELALFHEDADGACGHRFARFAGGTPRGLSRLTPRFTVTITPARGSSARLVERLQFA